MNSDSLWTIFINACLVNNFVLAWFLGICPFLGVSGKMVTATRMGAAVSFVMVIASLSAWGINALLVALGARQRTILWLFLSEAVALSALVPTGALTMRKFGACQLVRRMKSAPRWSTSYSWLASRGTTGRNWNAGSAASA